MPKFLVVGERAAAVVPRDVLRELGQGERQVPPALLIVAKVAAVVLGEEEKVVPEVKAASAAANKMLKWKWIVIFVLAALVSSVGLLYLKLYLQPISVAPSASFTDTFVLGIMEINQGNYAQATMKYNQALQQATSKEQEGLVRLSLASSLWATDRTQSIDMLKAISEDETLPASYRAGSVITLLQLFFRSNDFTLASQIFTGDLWKSFSKDAPRTYAGLELAARQAYEWSANLYSTFQAEYHIALWYIRQVYYDNLPQETKTEYKKTAGERFLKGNEDLAFALIDGVTTPSEIGLGYNLKAAYLEFAYDLGGSSFEDVQNAYKNAIQTFANDEILQSRYNELYARIDYANFLARTDVKKYTADVQSILEPLYASSMETVFESLSRRIQNQADTPFQLVLTRLAATDPRFKQKIESLGWFHK